MATTQKATLVGNALEVTVEVDQFDYNGQPSKGITTRTVMGEAQIAAHMADPDFATIANAKLTKAGKDAVAKIVTDIEAAKLAPAEPV